MEDIFCKIVQGTAPAYVVFQNDFVLAFLDHEPYSKGHTLIVPKQHADDIFSLSDETLKAIAIAAKLVSQGIRNVFGFKDISIFSNNGPHIQDIRHFHLHIMGKKPTKHDPYLSSLPPGTCRLKALQSDGFLLSQEIIKQIQSVALFSTCSRRP